MNAIGMRRERRPPPRLLAGATRPSKGALPLEPRFIQAVVRSRFDALRRCYERGLVSAPTLHGRVAVRFAIQRDGHVAWAVDDGSDLPDARVTECILTVAGRLVYPRPTGDIVTAVYPIQFSVRDPPPAEGAR